ncbi:MAG TPA: hypothetical protein VJN88_03500 [Ktedonobacterales bacterium]|nr:hypothetical protein [Ktedonobacterales bacterium]
MGSVTPAPAGASQTLATTSDPSRDRHESRLRTATRYALIELARNRMAFGLLVVFVPLWYGLLALLVTTAPVAFQLNATGAFLQVNGRDITVLTAGYNAITLIVGFLIYSATRRGSRFDRRLTLAGYPQLTLVCAKLIALVIASAAIALYADLVMLAFWRPESFVVVWLGFFFAALAYGTLGLFLGVLVTSELAGFFVIIMVSLMDTFLQNPVANPVANKPILRVFPSYGSMQIGVAGGFTSTVPGVATLIALAWVVGFALAGLSVFWWRTRPRGQLRG